MTARDRGHVEEIINHLKRVENDYGIDLTEEMEWLRGLVKLKPIFKIGDTIRNKESKTQDTIIGINGDSYLFQNRCALLITHQDQWELVKEPKTCMYTKDHYADEDRKILCDGCKEECKYSKSDDFTKALAECIHQAQGNVVDPMVLAETWKDELIKLAKSEEPVSEELADAAITAANEDMQGRQIMEESNENRQLYSRIFRRGFKAGANWQKEQMMKDGIDGKVFENYDGKVIEYDEMLLDDKLSDCEVFDKVKVIVIKEASK